MTGYTQSQLWLIILAMGVGTYAIRFSFLGLIGRRKLPAWVLRHLRYAPMAVIPALIAPLVLWPQATGGEPDPARLTAAGATLVAGALFKNTLAAIAVGALTLFTGFWLTGQIG
jgi:branched-subunit amino acid transport protein